MQNFTWIRILGAIEVLSACGVVGVMAYNGLTGSSVMFEASQLGIFANILLAVLLYAEGRSKWKDARNNRETCSAAESPSPPAAPDV